MPNSCPPAPGSATPVGTTGSATRPGASAADGPLHGPLHGRMHRMDGLDAIRATPDALFPFSDTLGIRVVAAEPGEVLLSARPVTVHQGWPGNTHGGFIATLCDTACGLAAATLAPARHNAVTANLSIQYLRPAPADGAELGCLGIVTHREGTRTLTRADVTGGDGEVIAVASALILLRPDRTAPVN